MYKNGAKLLQSQYLSCNQFLENRIYKCIFEIKNLTKKCDITYRKSTNTKSPKMVSKRLKTHYLSSFEQFVENRVYHCIFETKNLTKKWDIIHRKSKNTGSQNWCQNGSKPII